MNDHQENTSQNTPATRLQILLELFGVSAKLGLTSFGGPVAHLGYFHEAYIRRRKWLDERSYADLVALCQLLPGPASSQVGIGIGIHRAGLIGGIIAWIGFTLPSAAALVLFALLLQGLDLGGAGWIHGLKIVAVVIVAHAILGMGQKLTPDRNRITVAVTAAAVSLMWQTVFTQVILIGVAALIGMKWYAPKEIPEAGPPAVQLNRKLAAGCLVLFAGLLIVVPLLRPFFASGWLALFDSFYRAGSLVFGGGHVVLPMLEREVVPAGWVSREDFLAGYGAAQAVPGPLFTFAAYLGAMKGGLAGAAMATAAIFLPAFLLVAGTLPFWDDLRRLPGVQGALSMVNAAVVGILLAALYDPLWTSAILAPADFALAAILFVLLVFWKLPPWVIVIAGAGGGILLNYL
ncbi:chromate transporter [Paenibacillus tepidiphilus]|uniref:chromate transporter n=1 Tax=Paenibacillus tepidiphilus TaxID=2608683 RepID=UPI001239CB08|nr:chromate transporter [Paenibacillus tepidiphilus]